MTRDAILKAAHDATTVKHAHDFEWHRFTMATLVDMAEDPKLADLAYAEIDRRDRLDIRRIR
jgi:hypothetical protein